MELDGILKFTKLIHDFQNVKRAVRVPGREYFENDVEHSYQLALVAWYVIDSQKLALNTDLAIKYALLHDLVEVYAGDTNAMDPNPEVHATKAEREHQAFLKLKTDLVEFPELLNLIEAYEHKQDEEAKFVYHLDKILPPLNIYLDNGRAWRDHNVNFPEVIAHGSQRVAGHPEIKKYFDQLTSLIEKDKDKLFKNEEVQSATN